MDKQPIGFMSYAHFDDENDNKFVTWFCKRLSSQIRAHIGEEFSILRAKSATRLILEKVQMI